MGWFYTVFYIYIFIFGSCIGSFLNVVAERTAEGKSFIKGRSQCPICGNTLTALDLIPVFSYLFLRGRCRHCKEKISPRYLITELVCGGAFVFCFWWYGFGLEAVTVCILAALLLCVFLIDMQTMTIPNILILFFLAPAILEVCRTGSTGIWDRAIGFFVISVPLLILTLIIPGCFGGGDIKLVAVCGFILGYQAMLFAAFLSIVSCGIVSVILLAKKKIKKSDHIAFGPYLSCGILLAKFFAAPVIAAYLSLLNV